MSVNLPYNYVILDGNNCVVGCKTYSYEVPLDNFILVDYLTSDYMGKYYNPADGMFYYEPEYINVFDPEA